MKKENMKYLIIPLLALLFYGFMTYRQTDTSKLVLYKNGYYNDCYNIKKEPNELLIMNDVITLNKLKKNDTDMYEYYEKSSCVNIEGYTLKNYMIIDDYKIDHEKGRNDQAYQISYQEVLKKIEVKQKKTKFDKKIIEALEYYIDDKDLSQLIPRKSGVYQLDRSLIGPTKNDSSGKYVLAINIELANNVINDKNNKIVTENIIFDGISMEYIKVGE
ncbi:hypothetical protein LJB88_02560 [Erysipelotrichaceae bacterium OttesenSCG-928-M19]|nr:hypothetical protein [Erysipelotrichaceae bacterium OttesenSCG-928-M19]